jgi:hypothetical protein
MLPAGFWMAAVTTGALATGWQLAIPDRRPARPAAVRHARSLSAGERRRPWQLSRWSLLGVLGGCLGLAARHHDLALAWPLLGGIVLAYISLGRAWLAGRRRSEDRRAGKP